MYLKEGDVYRIVDVSALVSGLEDGEAYLLNADIKGFFLTKTEKFKIPKKIYGNSEKIADRVLKRYNETGKSLGVALTGLKGSGKSLTAKMICLKSNMPTIIVNTNFSGSGFESLISKLSEEKGIIVLFDEFEKVYAKDQENLLSLLDGTIVHNCIFIFTTNNKYNHYLENRLSRIHYHIEYKGLDSETIEEVIDDLLINKEYRSELLNILEFMNEVNLDLLICFISEINMFDESPSKVLPYLNIIVESQKYEVKCFVSGIEVELYNPKRNMVLFEEEYFLELKSGKLELLKPLISEKIYDKLTELDDNGIDLKLFQFKKDGKNYVFKLTEDILLIFTKDSVKEFSFSNLKF